MPDSKVASNDLWTLSTRTNQLLVCSAARDSLTCKSGRMPAAILLSDAALRWKLFLLVCVCARLAGLPLFLACVTVKATPPSSPAATPMVFAFASPKITAPQYKLQAATRVCKGAEGVRCGCGSGSNA